MSPTNASKGRSKTTEASLRAGVRGLLPFAWIVANLAFWCIPLIALTLVKLALPVPRVRRFLDRLMAGVYHRAVDGDGRLLFGRLRLDLTVEGLEAAYPDRFYVLVANHQSWSDILILQHLFNRRAPLLKFLVKRELLLLPLVGLICWAYDFPFLRRRRPASGGTGDRDRVDRALRRFQRSSATIVNFVEGTRFSTAKARTAPFRRLLKPKAGGLTWILQALGPRLGSILDVTLVYPDAHSTFWELLCGRTRRVAVRVRRIPIQEVLGRQVPADGRPEHSAVQDWVNRLWYAKDRDMERLAGQINGRGGAQPEAGCGSTCR